MSGSCISLSKTNNYNDISLKGLFSLAQASAEDPNEIACYKWCYYVEDDLCVLDPCGDENGTYTLNCINGHYGVQ